SELSGRPLDAVVRELFELSWGRARAFVTSGKISVDGETVTAGERRVREGAEIVLSLAAPRPRRTDLARERVVFLDTHVVVVDKPAGVSTVPHPEDPETETGTLDARVRAFLAKKDKEKKRGA